jgi:hypothetical protein
MAKYPLSGKRKSKLITQPSRIKKVIPILSSFRIFCRRPQRSMNSKFKSLRRNSCSTQRLKGPSNL